MRSKDKNHKNPLRLMQDVSYEPLMLRPSEILKQAWIFLVNHTITPPGSCIHRKAINKNKPSLSSGVLPSRHQSSMSRLPGTPPPSVYQVTHGTALQAAECYVRHLVMVLPSRQRDM